MKDKVRFLLLLVVSVPLCVAAQPDEGRVVLTILSKPLYPRMAKQARISGDVEVMVRVRADGSMESANAVSGHRLLRSAAVESAQKSQYECRGCTASLTSHLLVYSYQIAEASECLTETRVIQAQNHLTLVAPPGAVEIDFADVSARSAKCLYLWQCGREWGGMEFYYYRVRSTKCIYLWKCGYRPRPSAATSCTAASAAPQPQ